MVVAALLAWSLTAPPALPSVPMHSVPSGPAPHPHRVGTRGGPDFIERIQGSPSIARVVVQTGPGLTKEGPLPVHVDAWLKGSGPDDITVDFGGLRPMTAAGHAEILFLSRPLGDGGNGSDFRCVQERNEQWEVADPASAKVDQAVRDELAGAPESTVLAQLLAAGPRLSQQAASHLGLLAATSPQALADADAATRDPNNLPAARAELVTFLPSRLPLATLVGCTAGTEPPAVRAAAIQSLGRAALTDPTKKDQVLPILRAAAAEHDVALQLAAGTSLAHLHSADALPPVDAVLKSGDPGQRMAALLPLGELARAGDATALARLEALGSDPSVNVAKLAQQQLGTSRPHPAAGSGSPIVVGGVILLAVVVVGAAARWRRRRRAS